MSFKLVPFDVDQARNGAQVYLEDGTAVEIVNFNLRVGSWPILGRFTYGGIDCYEVWPRSGSYRDEIGVEDGAPQDLKIRQDIDETDGPDETDYEAERDYQGQVNALRDEIEELEEIKRRHISDLAAMRSNYQTATLKIKELDQVVEKERRERERLEVWQKETLEVLKDWRQVEDFVNAEDGRADHEIGLEPWAVVLSRLKTLRDLAEMLKKF